MTRKSIIFKYLNKLKRFSQIQIQTLEFNLKILKQLDSDMLIEDYGNM